MPFPHGDPTANSVAHSTETRGDAAAPAAQAEPQAAAGGGRTGGTALGLLLGGRDSGDSGTGGGRAEAGLTPQAGSPRAEGGGIVKNNPEEGKKGEGKKPV